MSDVSVRSQIEQLCSHFLEPFSNKFVISVEEIASEIHRNFYPISISDAQYADLLLYNHCGRYWRNEYDDPSDGDIMLHFSPENVDFISKACNVGYFTFDIVRSEKPKQ